MLHLTVLCSQGPEASRLLLKEVKPVSLSVCNALSVMPEGKLRKDAAVRFRLPLLKECLPLFLCLLIEALRKPRVILCQKEPFSPSDLLGGLYRKMDPEAPAGLSAPKGDLIKIRLISLRLRIFLLLIPSGNKEEPVLIQPPGVPLILSPGKLPQASVLQIRYPDARVIAIPFLVAPAHRKGRLPSLRGQSQIG